RLGIAGERRLPLLSPAAGPACTPSGSRESIRSSRSSTAVPRMSRGVHPTSGQGATMIGTACDLAISAVTSDVGLVAELQTHLTPDLTIADPRLDVMSAGEDVVSPLDVEYSRLAVILYQRLWLHDPATRRDEIVLRERIR